MTHGNRTVTRCRLLMSAFSPFSKGEMPSVFFTLCFLCLVRCLLPFFCRSSQGFFFLFFFFRERTFVFGWWCWSCVFWWVFAYVLALFFGGLLPKVFGKILLMSGLVFFGFVLSSFGSFVDAVFAFFFLFLFKRYSSGSNRTPPHAPFCLFLFSFCAPPRLLFRPFWPCVLLLGVFSGCHSGPRAFLGFSLYPSEVFFLGREAARVFRASLALFFFFPFCFVLRPHLFSTPE